MADKEATLLLKVKASGTEEMSKVNAGLLNIKNAIDIAKEAYAKIKQVVDAVIGAWMEQESATNSLNQSMVQQGIYTRQLSDSYQQMAGELQKVSLFGDEQIVQSQSIIQGYVGQNQITKELMKSIMDFATIKKMDLASAAELVGKTIGSETNALTRYGIEVDSAGTKSEKMAAVTLALTSRFGGQAEAATKGTGAFKQLSNAVGDLMEIMGSKIAPMLTSTSKSITEVTYKTSVWMDIINTLVGAASILKNAFMGVVDILRVGGQEIVTVWQAVSYAMSGNFKLALETMKTGNAQAGQIIVDRAKITASELTQIWSNHDKDTDARRQEELAKIAANEESKRRIQEESAQIQMESFTTQKSTALENELALEAMRRESLANQDATYTQAEIDNAKTKEDKLRMMQVNQTAFEQQQSNVRFQAALKEGNLRKILATEQVQTLQSTFATISTMQDSHNKAMAAVGKAAAIANIIIGTASGMGQAMKLGPWVGIPLAALVAAAGAAQIAKVNGVQLAEGGIVKATSGGVPAVIGEGGRDEAVIPLDKSGGMGGNTITINSYGGMLGTDTEAREFAIAIDRELMKLRQNKESVAFDSDLA